MFCGFLYFPSSKWRAFLIFNFLKSFKMTIFFQKPEFWSRWLVNIWLKSRGGGRLITIINETYNDAKYLRGPEAESVMVASCRQYFFFFLSMKLLMLPYLEDVERLNEKCHLFSNSSTTLIAFVCSLIELWALAKYLWIWEREANITKLSGLKGHRTPPICINRQSIDGVE